MNLRPLIASVWRSDLFLARLTVGLGSLYWASMLLFDDPQFYRSWYVSFVMIAPQYVWGSAFLLASAVQLLQVFAGSPVHHGWYACLMTAMIAGLWWMATFSVAFALDPSPAVNAGNLAICFLASLIFFRTLASRG